MYPADALSRAFLPDIIAEQFKKDIESEKYIHLMSKTAHVTDRKQNEIKNESSSYESMQTLVKNICGGWPSDKTKVPSKIREYYADEGELLEHDGIIYKDSNILVPPKLRGETLRKLHI